MFARRIGSLTLISLGLGLYFGAVGASLEAKTCTSSPGECDPSSEYCDHFESRCKPCSEHCAENSASCSEDCALFVKKVVMESARNSAQMRTIQYILAVLASTSALTLILVFLLLFLRMKDRKRVQNVKKVDEESSVSTPVKTRMSNNPNPLFHGTSIQTMTTGVSELHPVRSYSGGRMPSEDTVPEHPASGYDNPCQTSSPSDRPSSHRGP